MSRWPLPFLCVLLVCGCGGNDSKIVGSWEGKFVGYDGKTSPGASLTLDKEHHWRELFRNLEITGSWTATDKEVTLKVETLGGLPIAEAKKRVQARAKANSKLNDMAESIEKPVVLQIESDGTLTRDDAPLHGKAIFSKQLR